MIAEYIFSIGAIIFTIALAPTLFNKEAVVPLWSSVTTATVLTSYVFAFADMEQVYPLITTAGTASMWWLIAIFRSPKKEEVE